MTRFGVLAGAIMVQLILGTVYGYSIFWEPLSAEVFPEVVTESEYAELVAAGDEGGHYKVVATEEQAQREGVQWFDFGASGRMEIPKLTIKDPRIAFTPTFRFKETFGTIGVFRETYLWSRT